MDSSTGLSGYEQLLVRSRASTSSEANHKRTLSDLPSASTPTNRRRSSDPPTSMSDHLRLVTGAIDASSTTLSSSDMRISHNVPLIDPIEHTEMIMELAPPVQHSNLTSIISHSSTGLSGYEQLLVRPRVFNLSIPEPEPKQTQHPVSTSAHRRRTLDVPVSASATKRLAAGSSDSTAYPVAVPPAFTILLLGQEEGRPHSASSGIRTEQTQRSSSEHWIPTPALIEPDTGPVMRCSPGTPGGKSGQG